MSRPPENQSSSSSSSPRPTDPFELWRQIYETNERAWNAVLERTVNNPAFAESSGKILETFLSAQKTIRENMRSYLEQINLPTREDIGRLGELIVSLEEKVDQLDDRLARIERAVTQKAADSAPSTPAASAPARPKPATTQPGSGRRLPRNRSTNPS
jgi:polyhydroxyalkanoic acid synthase PhaR subunit